MPGHIRDDLLPLLLGNLDHIAEVRAQAARHERELDIEHREWMICLGRGFDFLHTPNIALIVGPYSPNLDGPVRKATAIIRENMAAGHIPDDGFLLLASVPYDDLGVDRARAELKYGSCHASPRTSSVRSSRNSRRGCSSAPRSWTGVPGRWKKSRRDGSAPRPAFVASGRPST